MRYIYAYKSSDGVRHEAEIEAESREYVFAELRKRGIRAIKVVASDGSKANGEIRGARKRIVMFFIFIAVAFAVGTTYIITIRSHDSIGHENHKELIIARALPRQTIPGDRRRINEAAQKLFESKAEQFLARFVEPGRSVSAQKSEWPTKIDFDQSLKSTITFSEDEFSEYIAMKRMVVWLKREMSAYLRGGGTETGYIEDLIKRQNMEIEYRDKANTKLEEMLQQSNHLKDAYTFWLKANAQLQAMGIYPIPLPSQLKDFQYADELE